MSLRLGCRGAFVRQPVSRGSSATTHLSEIQRMSGIWQALAREAALAAEHLVIGASAIDKADHGREGTYSQMLFALSIGFERSAKLAVVVDHALVHDGAYPEFRVLRSYGHNIKELLEEADAIAARRNLPMDQRLPRSDIHPAIIDVLDDFASNVTRYYNLDVVTGDPRTSGRIDPSRAWFERVTLPVIRRHRPSDWQELHKEVALDQNARTLRDAFTVAWTVNRSKPFVRLYVLQIARFLGFLLGGLGHAGYHVHTASIPHLSEFFAIINNPDVYLRKRKTWSIYNP